MASAAVSLATWQERRADQRSQNALVARLAQLEHWQQARFKAAVELAALIERRQLEIENVRAQIGKEISA